MGKSLPYPTRFQEFSKLLSSSSPAKVHKSKQAKPIPKIPNKSRVVNPNMETGRTPLAQVVSDCVKRWFDDTLKEAKSGDIGMQVLVGQMYSTGYGIPKDEQKGRAWISRASKSRSSVWKVSEKRPGYNASDSDSDEVKNGTK